MLNVAHRAQLHFVTHNVFQQVPLSHRALLHLQLSPAAQADPGQHERWDLISGPQLVAAR